MSAEHNHAQHCCCNRRLSGTIAIPCPGCPDHGPYACICGTPGLTYAGPERECPVHGESAGPYTEQETTK